MSKESATHAAKPAPATPPPPPVTYNGYIRAPGAASWGQPVVTGAVNEALARVALGNLSREELDQLGFPYQVSTASPDHALVLLEGRDPDTEKPPAEIDPTVGKGRPQAAPDGGPPRAPKGAHHAS
jgi:hypothetical protein